MGFLSPWFLGGLLAAGIPIYVHLLRQHRSNPLPFSSLMFFERRTQSSIKHRRLKYLALLALRIALIVLLALMFANPFVRRSESAASGRKLLVLAVDSSFSMRAGGRFGAAKQQAIEALSSFRPGDRGQIVSFSAGVQFHTQAVEDVQELRSAIVSMQGGDGRSSYGELARTLRGLAQSGGPPMEVHVFSDMQRSSLPSPFSELALPPEARLLLHSVSEKREPNWYVESVNAPHSVFQPKKTRVRTTIAGAGTEAKDLNVQLLLNGKSLESKRVKVGANGRSTVEFYLPDAPYGLNRAEVRIDGGDQLREDDTFPFALERKESSRVLFVHDARQGRGAGYFRTAVEAMPDAGFALDAVTSDQVGNVSPDKYAFVVLSDVSNLPGSFASALTSFVRKGGSVWVALGPASIARGRVPLAEFPINESRYASRDTERFQAIGSVDETYPAVGKVNKFDGVKFYLAAKVDPGKARVAARLADGTPLLIEQRLGEGKVLVFTSTFDNISNDLPLHASFLPFVEQAALYLSGNEAADLDYPVDSSLELRASRDSDASVDVIDPEGKRALSLRESATAQAFRLSRAGFYEVRRGNGRQELIAVHTDRRESDLDVIPKETLALWQNTGQTPGVDGTGGTQQQKPFSLWWYFALALLGVTVAESLFASRYLAAEEEPAVQRRAAA